MNNNTEIFKVLKVFKVFKEKTIKAGKLIDGMDNLLVKMVEDSEKINTETLKEKTKQKAIRLSGILMEIRRQITKLEKVNEMPPEEFPEESHFPRPSAM